MNRKTRNLLTESDSYVHIATLVRECRLGSRCPGILLQNIEGVYGVFYEGMPYVIWGSPGQCDMVLKRIDTLMRHQFTFYSDDGAVLRKIDRAEELVDMAAWY